MSGLIAGMSAAPMAPLGQIDRWVPIRSAPDAEDANDGRRIELVRARWAAQDAALLARDRQVEEHVRMIVGRQWDVFSPILGQYVDVTKFMTEDERRWRQRPVVNRLLHWFILTHARLTENPPVVTFQPRTTDRLDQLLAEAMDTIFKTLWGETDMLDALDRVMAWLPAGGQGYLKSRVDFTLGEEVGYLTDTQQPIDPSVVGQIHPPKIERQGQIVMDVLGPLECRGEWGSKPWHRKRWHTHRSFLTPDEVQERYGLMVPPDTFQAANSDGTGGYLTRILFGSGYFGAAQGKDYGQNIQGMGSEAARQEGYVTIDEMWEVPSEEKPGYSTDDSPGGGRLLTVSRTKVLSDSGRPYPFKYCSPIRQFTFVNVPGRPAATTPLEMLAPIQKTYNRGVAQILEHRNLTTNPILVVDNGSGIQEGQITNRPGTIIHANLKPGVSDPIYYLRPPPISDDVWKTQDFLSTVMDFLGNISGSVGETPNNDPSGELIKQLRYNNDRFIGPTVKRSVQEMVRVAEDWRAILPLLWTTEKVLAYTGEDNIGHTLTIMPELWDGEVRIEPDIDSMIPESRSEKQARMFVMYQAGILGQVGTPEAASNFVELVKFPHRNRLDFRGGVHRITAQQVVGKLVQGAQASDIPIFEWYNLPVFTQVLEEFMSSPEYIRLTPELQEQFVLVRENVQGMVMQQQMKMMQQAAPMAALAAAHAGAVNTVAQAHNAPGANAPPQGGGGPPPPSGGGGGGGAAAGKPGVAAEQPQAPAPLNTPPVQDR